MVYSDFFNHKMTVNKAILYGLLIHTRVKPTISNKQTRTIKVSEMTDSLRRHYKSRSHGKDCLKR